MNATPEHKTECRNANLIIWFLGITGIILAIGVVFLTFHDKKIDGGLFTMAGGVVGSLGTMLQQRQQQRATDEPVPVVNGGVPLETRDVPPITPPTDDSVALSPTEPAPGASQ